MAEGPSWQRVEKQPRTSKPMERPDLDRWMAKSEVVLNEAVSWLERNGVDWSVSPDEV